jgi:hypothetical protein
MDHTHEVGGSSPSAPTGRLCTKWHGVLSSDTDVTCGWGLFWRVCSISLENAVWCCAFCCAWIFPLRIVGISLPCQLGTCWLRAADDGFRIACVLLVTKVHSAIPGSQRCCGRLQLGWIPTLSGWALASQRVTELRTVAGRMDFPGNKALKATLPADEVTPAILPHVGEATAKR